MLNGWIKEVGETEEKRRRREGGFLGCGLRYGGLGGIRRDVRCYGCSRKICVPCFDVFPSIKLCHFLTDLKRKVLDTRPKP